MSSLATIWTCNWWFLWFKKLTLSTKLFASWLPQMWPFLQHEALLHYCIWHYQCMLERCCFLHLLCTLKFVVRTPHFFNQVIWVSEWERFCNWYHLSSTSLTKLLSNICFNVFCTVCFLIPWKHLKGPVSDPCRGQNKCRISPSSQSLLKPCSEMMGHACLKFFRIFVHVSSSSFPADII